MPKINLLPNHIAELIAAGEVVERPASVVKEMVENSIDAGATHITVEIQRGGITYIRITDNGCGIDYGDVPTAFLRHATSKISAAADLDSIATLGFRGEALAAAASVSKIELFSKTADSTFGTHYIIEGGEEILYEESGCPDGTTVIVRDLFYNTPARMKFLKKDVSEGNAVAAVIERAALSHPEISFKLIRDSKQTLSTSGDGKAESAIYSVLGRDFSKSLIPINTDNAVVNVSGFICKPVFCRQSRAGQYTFLNSRLVHSGTVTAAVEQAYKNSAMVGKFPAFVLNVTLPFDMVDVNVHPAKTEVRFSDEKKVFEAVHYAVKDALLKGDTRPEISVGATQKKPFFERMTAQEYRQQSVNIPKTPAETAYSRTEDKNTTLKSENIPFYMRKDVKKYIAESSAKPSDTARKNEERIAEEAAEKAAKPYERPFDPTVKRAVDVNISVYDEDEKISQSDEKAEAAPERIEAQPQLCEEIKETEEEIRYIGEAFSTYIIVEKGSSVFLIDKHAAHERIIFNRLKASQEIEVQPLLMPITVRLNAEEYDIAIKNTELMLKAGFEIDDFGNGVIAVRAVPAALIGEDVESVVVEAVQSLSVTGSVSNERLDRIFHTVACKAAIKAGSVNMATEHLHLAERVLDDRDVMYCPHGRPVAFEFKKSALEKQFGRIQ